MKETKGDKEEGEKWGVVGKNGWEVSRGEERLEALKETVRKMFC